MKFPYSMLLDFVETHLNAEQAGDLLTMAGFELEGIEEVNGEPVLDIKVMSNRGDGLSVFGLAREVLAKESSAKPTALYLDASRRFVGAETAKITDSAATRASVQIQTSDCTRYACRLYHYVQNGSSPSRIQERLIKAGMRPISLLVDLTNYVMLELGQPLHSFDYDKLRGGQIVVRQAAEGEKITTLDGQERDLTPDMMMICDAERPVAIAGVMGGAETEVSAGTKTVLLESAHFVNTSVRKTRTTLGMSTEASYRFERSVDPDGVVAALERFSQLLAEVPGSGSSGETIDVYPAPPAPRAVRLRIARSDLLLGMPIRAEEAQSYLTKLGFGVTVTGEGEFQVVAPSWRPDVLREEDVIEELGRVHGYERIPEALPRGSTTLGGPQGYEFWKDKVRESAVRLGFNQTISHTLRDLCPLDNPRLARIGPRGINDPDMMWLRNSTLSSLADASQRNGGKDVQLFEMGQVFGHRDGNVVEVTSIGFLLQGSIQAGSWDAKELAASTFFNLKGLIAELATRTLHDFQFRAPDHRDSRLHPTRQAELVAGQDSIGILGQIDPDVADRAGIPGDTMLAEIDLAKAYEHALTKIHVRPISKNPAVRPDIAFLIDKSVPFAKISETLSRAAGELLEKSWLFDVYEGKGVPEGQHSLAIALQLRKLGGNLTDEEATQVRERVVQALAGLGATPRG